MIKRTIIPAILFLTLTTNANAQFKKGMRMAGATIVGTFFNSSKTDFSYPPPTIGYTSNNTSFGINLNPSMGWFVSDNTVVGGSIILGYDHQKNFNVAAGTTFSEDISNTLSLGVGGFVRNYFNSSGTFLPYGQFSLNFGTGSSNDNGFIYSSNNKSTYDGKSSGDLFANATFALGVTKMITSNTGLEIYAGYAYSYTKNTFKTTTLVDIGADGTIDQTQVSEPTKKFTNNGAFVGAGFQIFLDPRK